MISDRIFLSLGSNQGDRKANLERALQLLESRIGAAPECVSDFIQTKSWGFDAPDFINAVVVFRIDVTGPFALLDICKDIEREMGRDEVLEFDGNGKRIYHSRVIDIDILMAWDMTVETERLTIPHPLMHERDFVMVPLRQVCENLNIKL